MRSRQLGRATASKPLAPAPQADVPTARMSHVRGTLPPDGDLLLRLQQVRGNSYVQRVIRQAPPPTPAAPAVGAKLTIGVPGDRYEREADRMARQVTVQPLEQPGASAHRSRGGGQSLADPVMRPMEQAFGADFRRVRVHQGAEPDELCRTIAARAFTIGDHIFVRNGEHVGTGPSGRHLLAHELAHVIQQQRPAAPPRDMIQAFWVRKGGTYKWVADQAKKQRYVRTAQGRRTFERPMRRAVYVDPWAPGTRLRVDPSLGFEENRADLEARVIEDLKRIRRTDVGATLLGMLAATLPGSTTILPQEGIRGPVTQTEQTDQGLMTNVVLTPGQLDAAEALADQGIRVQEAEWNPSPSDVVLFHELLHAYHNLNGSRATGQVTPEQAIHQGDAGQLMSEYQVVGLNTADADPEHQYGLEYFTENEYRNQTDRPHRDTYLPRRAPVAKPKPVKKKPVKKKRKQD